MPHDPATTIVFDTIPVAGVLLELDGTIVAANRAAYRLAERPAPQLVGLPIGEVNLDVGTRWAELLEVARRDGQVVVETWYPARSGVRSLELVLSFAELDGRQIVQAFAIDITDRKAAVDAAHARASHEEQVAAKQRLESLGLVAGGIAHDFNNLLVGVLAEASAVREDRELVESTREALRRIEAAALRMAQLTRQLLAYAGRGQFVTTAVDPDALVSELREQLGKTVRPDVKLQVLPNAGTIVVEADAGLLRQVVLNLVANASDAGGGRVDVSTRMIVRESAPWWQLEVGDDGCGIDRQAIGRIFEPFYTTKADRHGLGLSAVHGIVRRLGGEVEVDSERGQGARFRVRLPITVGAEPARRPPSEPSIVPPARKLAGIRVLVVDDEPSVRATVRRLLERRGATVVVAADGLEAEISLHDEQFGLVVSDVSMPGRTGHEVLVIARATQPGTPVMLMSGYTERIRGAGSEEEADAFLEKPFTAKALDQQIDLLLFGKL